MDSDDRAGIMYTAGAASGTKYSIRGGMGDKPVNYVSRYDAAHFSNLLGNGDTETEAYTLNGNPGITTKNVSAKVWILSENEWYKAAYYDPTPLASTSNYWLYPMQSETIPTVAAANSIGVISNPGANVANYSYGADWNSQD